MEKKGLQINESPVSLFNERPISLIEGASKFEDFSLLDDDYKNQIQAKIMDIGLIAVMSAMGIYKTNIEGDQNGN